MEIISSCCCLEACDKNGFMCPSIWPKLPVDLFIELLRRLPEKALLQFRCGSKDSNFVISKYFLPKLAVYARVDGFVFQWQRTIYPPKPRKPDPPPKDFYGYVSETGGDYAYKGGELVKSYLSLLPFKPSTDDFLGCFNGFFLVRNSSFVPIGYYVCNPATRQCVPIPLNHQHVQKDSFVGLAFDPLDRPNPATVTSPYHNFKIVRVDCSSNPIIATSSAFLNNQQPPRRRGMDVFSSATGKWIKHQIPLEPEILEFYWNMRYTYVDGVLYMLSMCKYLLCFDLNNTDNAALKARAIRLPPTSRDDRLGIFEKSNECLYYACKVNDDLLVWTFQLSNKASPWTLKYNINTCLFESALRRRRSIFAVDLSAEIIYVGDKFMALSFDIKNNQFERFGFINYGYIIYGESLCFYPYSCCLVRLSDHFSVN